MTSAQTDRNDFDFIVRFISFGIGLCVADILTDFHAFVDAAEDCVFVVQPRRWANSDEELTSIAVGSSVGHRNRVRTIVLQVRRELIFEVISPD